MRTAAPHPPDDFRDVKLEQGCILCGGPLELRVSTSGVRTYCRACRWISSPTMERDERGEVHVVHPAGGHA
jgi:hypothetical protein